MNDQQNGPTAIQSEISLLSALLGSATAIEEVSHLLTPADFQMPAHVIIYGALQRMHGRGVPVNDLTLVSHEIEEAGQLTAIHGPQTLQTLLEERAFPHSAVGHAQVILDKAKRRRLLALANTLSQSAHDATVDIDTVLSDALTSIERTAENGVTSGAVSMEQAVNQQWTEVAFVADGGVLPSRLPSRFPEAKFVLRGGFADSGAYVIAGRPGAGKSSIMHAEAAHAARWFLAEHKRKLKAGIQEPLKRVVIYTLEMPVSQVMDALAAIEVGIPYGALYDRELNLEQIRSLNAAAADLAALPIDMDDTLTQYEAIEADIKRRWRRGELGAAYIDQLSILDTAKQFSGQDDERRRINFIMPRFKRLAMKVKRPLFMLHQINREGDDEPKLKHLKDSGKVEESADCVIFVHRDMEEAETLQPWEVQDVTMIAPKNRHGRIGRWHIGFRGEFKAFVSKARIAQNGNGR